MTTLTNGASVWTPAQEPLGAPGTGSKCPFQGLLKANLKNGVKSGAPARRRSSPVRLTDLVGTQTLQRVVSKLIPHVHQAVAGVDVVQAVGLGLA